MELETKIKLPPQYWLEIDLKAILFNIKNIKSLIGKNTSIIAVIKSNAYGHGILEVAKLLTPHVSYFAVAGLEEVIILRESGISIPILFLSNPLNEEDYELIFDYKITPTINNFYSLEKFDKLAGKYNSILSVHLKIDTGMGRMGINWEEKEEILNLLLKAQNLKLEAIYTHFSKAEDPQYTRLQMERFEEVVSYIKKFYRYNFKLHAANSCATLKFSSSWYDLVRIGLIIYGIYPEIGVRNRIELRQAMSFKTKLIEVKEVKKGDFIGYNCTYKTPSDTKIGIIPVGYSQGLPLSLSNKGFVLIRGKRIPIIGRISMDETILDLREIENPQIGEETVITGIQGEEEIRIEELAELSGTIPYEILCRFGKNKNKIYIKNV
jgi:alanine racemase